MHIQVILLGCWKFWKPLLSRLTLLFSFYSLLFYFLFLLILKHIMHMSQLSWTRYLFQNSIENMRILQLHFWRKNLDSLILYVSLSSLHCISFLSSLLNLHVKNRYSKGIKCYQINLTCWVFLGILVQTNKSDNLDVIWCSWFSNL